MHLAELTRSEWFWLLFCAFLVGVGKAGVKGMGLIVVPLLATIFGGKASSGLLLPMLVVADVFAVLYYNRHAQWSYLVKLLPAAVAGVLLGVWVGQVISDEVFKILIAVFILFTLVLMVLQERSGLPPELAGSWGFGMAFGLLGGFMTMIGNAAGPIMAVYLLSTRLPKNSFIGTGAWFFMLINWFKLPFHLFIWDTIDAGSLSLNAVAVPLIALGIFVGIHIVKRIPEKGFRIFILVMTTVVSVRLLWSVLLSVQG